jgi:hypothetical protein
MLVLSFVKSTDRLACAERSHHRAIRAYLGTMLIDLITEPSLDVIAEKTFVGFVGVEYAHVTALDADAVVDTAEYLLEQVYAGQRFLPFPASPPPRRC